MNYISVVGIIVFVFSLLCAVTVFFKSVKTKININWILLCMSICLWAQFVPLYFSIEPSQKTLMIFQFTMVLGLISIIFFLEFFKSFLNKKLSKTENIIFYFLTIIFLGLIIAYPSQIITTIGLTKKFYFNFMDYYYIIFGVYFLFSVYIFSFVFRKNKDKKIKDAHYIGMGVFIPLLMLFFPLLHEKLFILILCIVPLYLGFTTYNIMDNPLIIRRSFIYGIMIALVTGIYIFSVFLFESVFKDILGYNSMLARFCSAFLIAATFLPIRNKMENFIDKLFFRERYDYNHALKNFSEKLVSVLDLTQLMNMIVDTISKTLKVDYITLLLYDKNENNYVVKSNVGFDNITEDMNLSQKHALVQRIKTSKDIMNRNGFSSADKSSGALIKQFEILRAEICVPLFFTDKLVGILTLGPKKSGEEYYLEDITLLKTIANETAIGLSNALTYTGLKNSYWGTVKALATAIEAKDIYTCGHSERVVIYSSAIAKEMGLTLKELEVLRFGGILHDIGKIAIDDEILKKKTELKKDETNDIRNHPAAGESIIMPIKFLEPVRPIVRNHHERWDGTGYPDKLVKSDIPLLVRIIQIADTLDAMTSSRSYRLAKNMDDAVREIQKCSGTQFDPTIVYYFMKAFRKGNIRKESELIRRYI
jgi:putative nucleotidyltransferase with HDIG domain